MRSPHQRRLHHENTVASFSCHRRQCPLEVFGSCNRYHLELYPELLAGRFHCLQDTKVRWCCGTPKHAEPYGVRQSFLENS